MHWSTRYAWLDAAGKEEGSFIHRTLCSITQFCGEDSCDFVQTIIIPTLMLHIEEVVAAPTDDDEKGVDDVDAYQAGSSGLRGNDSAGDSSVGLIW